jgi:hypothetical protein
MAHYQYAQELEGPALVWKTAQLDEARRCFDRALALEPGNAEYGSHIQQIDAFFASLRSGQ